MGGTSRQYATATSRLLIDQGVASISVRGVVTGAVLAPLLADCSSDMRAAGRADALVARYDLSVIALDADQLLAGAARAIQPGKAIAVPTALVVPRDAAALFKAYAWRMAQRGIVRAVFTSPGPALAWAQKEAAVWAAHRAHHHPREAA